MGGKLKYLGTLLVSQIFITLVLWWITNVWVLDEIGKVYQEKPPLYYVLLLIFVIVNSEEDLYATLGLKRDASQRQIKKAYRSLFARVDVKW